MTFPDFSDAITRARKNEVEDQTLVRGLYHAADRHVEVRYGRYGLLKCGIGVDPVLHQTI